MSREAIDRFFSLLDADEDLQNTYWQEVGRATLDAVVALARRQSCEFTAEELSEVWADEEGELDEDSLDAVAAGTSPTLASTSYGGANMEQAFGRALSSKDINLPLRYLDLLGRRSR